MKLLVVVSLLTSLCTGARAADFSSIFVFGDSLSDSGNLCSFLASPPYFPGRCSNGPVWSEYLAAALGLELTPSGLFGEGNNYAFGGARSFHFGSQIEEFVNSSHPTDAPGRLYVVWFGGNDVLDAPTEPGAMADAAGEVADGIRELIALGGDTFLVPNLPDVGRLPGGTPFESALTHEFNDALDGELAALSGVTIIRVDVFSFFTQVLADPSLFGFATATVPCLDYPECEADPQGEISYAFLLFDAIHPTTAGHALLGQLARASMRDRDADGASDAVDNCLDLPNAAQRDTDGDGFGNACDADLDGDGVVNFLDLGRLKTVFFSPDPDGDLNGDGSVNFLDLGIMKSLFFAAPGPSAFRCAGSVPCPPPAPTP